MKIKGPHQMIAEFASTYKEWHYIVSCLSAGFVGGWVAHSVYALARSRFE